MKTFTLFITIVLNALSTGFFFSWSVSVIVGTKKTGDFTYLETMQSINKAILNPLFFVVFFGSLITLFFSVILQYNDKSMFWFIGIAAAIYLIGTFGATAFGNVPLNNELEALNLTELSTYELKSFRNYYESKWNQWHSIRTVSSVTSFVFLIIGTLYSR